uniref:DDE-1 domain-containing protein n=1 Tax=Peronospora matthiolae TaxID=2874970 RepID=A0AAV1T6Q9_9STRA
MVEDWSGAIAGRKPPHAPLSPSTQQKSHVPTPSISVSVVAPDPSSLPPFGLESLAHPHPYLQQSDGLPRATSGLPLGRRMRLTLGQKREVVDLAASKKFTHRELAEKFRVGRTTITNICRQEELIRTETDSADAAKKKRKTTKCTYDLRVLDECLHKWRMEVKVSSPETKLTGTVLQQKAMELACKIVQEPYADLPDKVKQALQRFTGSNGWLDGYRTRFGSFSSKQGHGEGEPGVIKSVDIPTRLRELHHSFSHATVEEMWTGAEFAVMYKPPVPDGSGPIDVNHGQYTVSLFVSAAGEKFKMQVIGVERNPVLLEGIDTKEMYDIQYEHSKTGWQVAQTTVSMLKSLNALARERKRTFRVVLDSAVPHVKAAMILDSQGDQRTFFVYDHLQIYFLPPNFTSLRFHPCHLGVIQAFKARFRSEMLESLFGSYRQSVIRQDPRGFHPQRHLYTRNVFHWLYVALHSLDTHLVQSCWVHSGLLPTNVIASLNLRVMLKSNDVTRSSVNVTPSTSSGSGSDSASANSEANDANIAAANDDVVSTVANQGGLPSPAQLYGNLQQQLTSIARLAPDFLCWIGVTDPSDAQAYVEIDGNASVIDPGIDEVQIIRSVLQKHGYLFAKKLDDESRTEGMHESLEDVAEEPCPRHDEVVASISVLKKYLRLSRDALPSRVEAVVQLNQVKKAVDVAAARAEANRDV